MYCELRICNRLTLWPVIDPYLLENICDLIYASELRNRSARMVDTRRSCIFRLHFREGNVGIAIPHIAFPKMQPKYATASSIAIVM